MSDGFLSRWSRRKRGEAEAEAEGPTPAEAPPAAPAAKAAPPAAPASTAAPPPTLAAEAAPPPTEPEPEFDLSQLPPLDTLTAESDFSVFFRPGVPAAIRGAALRKAWVADPLIRDHVSSLDYGWDFNAPASMPGFSLELGETGERLRKLIAQAVGEREEEEPAPAPPPEAAPAIVAGAVTAELPPPPEPALAAPGHTELGDDEPPAPPARRHGGAMPA